MAAIRLYDRAGVNTATAGTGTVTLGAAINNAYFTFAGAGVNDAETVRYVIDDGNDFEIGEGVYTAAGTTLTRATVLRSNIAGVQGTTKLTLSGSATVRIDCSRADLVYPMLFGPDIVMVNGTITTSVGSNILTVNIKTLAGSDPSVTDPVWFFFRNATGATGDYTPVRVTAALNMTTNAAGATLGTANNVPFRLWVLAFNNAGTVVLALFQSVTGGASPTAIAPLNEGIIQSTTAISGSATSAGVFYTPNGTTLTSKALRIIGYLDYNGGLATAGSYGGTPGRIQLFNPGIKKPGDVVQVVQKIGATQFTTTSNTFQTTNLSVSITPSNEVNLVKAAISGYLQISTSTTSASSSIFRGSTNLNGLSVSFGAANLACGKSVVLYDAPQTVSATTYAEKIKSADGTSTASTGTGDTIVVEEIMV